MSSNPKYKAFKPPRPVGASNDDASSSKPQKQKPPTKSHKSKTRGVSELCSPDPDEPVDRPSRRTDELDDYGGDSDVSMNEIIPGKKKLHDELAIPSKLLARLIHEHFQHEDTRITEEAMTVLSKYIEVFAMEALGRANEEREEAVKTGKSDNDSFLEVEDLEKLSPQLLLDF